MEASRAVATPSATTPGKPGATACAAAGITARRDGTLDEKVEKYGDEMYEWLTGRGLIDPVQKPMF